MSNSQWHDDQTAGERALRELKRRADLDSRLGDALRASGINAADALAVQALYATAGQSGSHRIVSALRAVESWIMRGRRAMIDESVCSVCARPTGFGHEDKGEPPVNLARCPAPGGMECRAVAQAVAPWRRENETLRSNCDNLSSENASLVSQNESMAMRIESLAEELAKPEDVRLREVIDTLDGRAVIFDGLGARVTHELDEMDEWIARAGEAERRLEDADAKLTAVRVALTEAGVPEVEPYPEEDVSDREKSLRAGGRVIGAVARIERLVARLAAAGDVVKMARQLVSYDWESRLDDSATSDAAKHDARELSYAIYEYDRTAKS